MKRNTTAILAAGLLLVAADAGLADSITYGSQTASNVRILDLREGELLFETAAGIEKSAPADLIKRIELDDHPELADAHTALENENFEQAAGIFRRVYQAVEADHLKTLILGKLVRTLDRAGQADEAVQRYLELLQRDTSPFAKAVMPANVPDDKEQREALLEPVAARADETSSRVAKALLEELLKRLRGQSTPSPTAPGTQQDPIANLLEQGKAEQALKMADTRLKEPRAPLSKLLYQRGLALAQLDRHKDAALSFMRVVVHFRPGTTTRYVPCLIEAGRAFQKMGNANHARDLWKEAAGLVNEGSDQAEQLKKLLGSLGTQ